MKNKKIIIGIVALIVVAGLMAGAYFATRPKTETGEKSFTVTVIHGDGGEKSFSYTTTEEYVGTVVMADGLVEGTVEQYGLYIRTVDGEQAVFETDGAYWAFYDGEEYATTGIDLTPIRDGASYKLVYTVD